MQKRQFLKISSAVVTAPLFSGLIGCNNNKESVASLKNWAGNLTYSIDKVTQVSSAAEVNGLVNQFDKVKVLGTRHCFNTIADSRDRFISLTDIAPDIVVNEGNTTVTVNSGIRYGQLSPYLHEKGFALHNLASLPHISVAGACATATHGSGEKSGNLSTAVAGMEFVTGEGETVHLTRDKDGENFNAAVVHLGALGVVTRLTLDIQPTFLMKQYVYERLPLSSLKEHFDEIEGSGYSVSLFTDWQSDDITEVWMKRREDEAGSEPEKEWFGATLATKNMHPIPELSAENCTEQMGVPGPWYDRMPHFKMGFTPSSGVELQSEYFVPRRNAVDAIMAISKLKDQVGPHLFTSEIRTIAADNFWMSPCYKQDSVSIHFTWKQETEAVGKLLPVIEKELAPFGLRPHWGKLFTIKPEELEKAYEKMPEFRELAKQYDPKGKFRNDFLNQNLFFR